MMFSTMRAAGAVLLCGALLALGAQARDLGFAGQGTSLVVTTQPSSFKIIDARSGATLADVDLKSYISNDQYITTSSTPDGRYLFSQETGAQGEHPSSTFNYVVTALGATKPKVLGTLRVNRSIFGAHGCDTVPRGIAVVKRGAGYRLFITASCSTTANCPGTITDFKIPVLTTAAFDYTLGNSGRLGTLKQVTKPAVLPQTTAERCDGNARGYTVLSNTPFLVVDANGASTASQAESVYEVTTSTTTLAYKLTYTASTPYTVNDVVAASSTSIYLVPAPRPNSPSKVFYEQKGKSIAAKGGPAYTSQFPFSQFETGHNYANLASGGGVVYATVSYQTYNEKKNTFTFTTDVRSLTITELKAGQKGTLLVTKLTGNSVDLTTVGSP